MRGDIAQQPRRTNRAVIAEANKAASTRLADFQHQVAEHYLGHLKQALPSHITPERFMRVLFTACSANDGDGLLRADRRSLLVAAIKCASDGLMPDGRQAALVVYNTEVKRRDPDTGLDVRFRADLVQYMPMVSGILQRMRNSGEMISAESHCVYKNDDFHYKLGDQGFIEHEPPPLDEERGDIIGAYAIIRLKSGEVLRDVMSKREIEMARSVSRAKDGPMWGKFYGEAARKTVLRRCSKMAPQTSELERIGAIIDRSEDHPEDSSSLPAFVELPPPSAPQPVLETDTRDKTPPPPEFEVVDLDGQVFGFQGAATAAMALRRVYEDAEERGPAFIDGARETNRETQAKLEKLGERFEAPSPPPPNQGTKVNTPPPQEPKPDEGPPFPGDKPTRPAAQPTRQQPSVIVVPVDENGRKDYRGWALGLFLPRVRQMCDSSDLAMFLGTHEDILEEAKRHLTQADRREFEGVIAGRWAEIENIERQQA